MSTGALLLALDLLALDKDAVTPGVLGFVVVALLGVATYLLIRSMNRQIRRIDIPESARDADTASPASSDERDEPDSTSDR